MKVAILVDAFPILTETFVLNQIAGLLDRGIVVDILAAAPGNHRSNSMYEKYCLAERTFYYSVGMNRLQQVLVCSEGSATWGSLLSPVNPDDFTITSR